MLVQLVVPLLPPNLLERRVSPWLLKRPLLLPQLVLLTLQVVKENVKEANTMITAIKHQIIENIVYMIFLPESLYKL